MADKPDLNQMMARHGDKAAVVLAALSLFAFVIMMVSSGGAEMAPGVFADQMRSIADSLDNGEADPVNAPAWGDAVRSTLASGERFSASPLPPGTTTIPPRLIFRERLEYKLAGKVPLPARELQVVMDDSGLPLARNGAVTLRWRRSEDPGTTRYWVKWWPDGRPEPASWQGDEFTEIPQPGAQHQWVVARNLGDGELVDNRVYHFRVRSIGATGRPVDYSGGEMNEDNLVFAIRLVGAQKLIPAPRGLTIPHADLQRVELEWDDPERHWRNADAEDFPFVDQESVRVRLVKWFGDDRENMELLTPEGEDGFETGWTLADLGSEHGTRYPDHNLRPEVPIHYGMQFYHVEAFPGPHGSSVNADGERIEDRSYLSDVTIEVPLKLDEDGDWELREVYASPLVEFVPAEHIGDRIVLPNRAVFVCERVDVRNWTAPRYDASARINITRYFRIRFPDGREIWQPFSAEFEVEIEQPPLRGQGPAEESLLGEANKRPDRAGGMSFNQWTRANPDTRVQNPGGGPWRPVADGQFDFRTPYALYGVFELPYQQFTGGEDDGLPELQYAELVDTGAVDDDGNPTTWPIRLYEDASRQRNPDVNAFRQGNLSGPTPAHRLAAWKELQDIDRNDPEAMYAWSGKWGIRWMPDEMLAQPGTLGEHNQFARLGEEGPRLLAIEQQWEEELAESFNPARRLSIDVEQFAFDAGGDMIVIPLLVRFLQDHVGDEAVSERRKEAAWQLVVRTCDRHNYPLDDSLKDVAVADMPGQVNRLATALMRYYAVGG